MNTVAVRHWEITLKQYPSIEVDPWIKHGIPTIKGTRIPVAVIIGYLTDSDMNNLLLDYPTLDRETVQQAVGFTIDVLGG